MHNEWGYGVDFGMLLPPCREKGYVGGMLPEQIHIGNRPSKDGFSPAKNEDEYEWGMSYHEVGFDKPMGGFWTSTKNEYGCDWLRFLCRDKFMHSSLDRGGMAWKIVPRADISVYVIEDEDDYELLTMCYPYEGRGGHTDWEAFAKHFDAIHVKAWRCMEAWDCETVVWFNMDAIEDVEECVCTGVNARLAIDLINGI